MGGEAGGRLPPSATLERKKKKGKGKKKEEKRERKGEERKKRKERGNKHCFNRNINITHVYM